MPKAPPSAVDKVVSLAKRRGFVYPCGEIYGGTRSAWDYGPLGVELKEQHQAQPGGRRRCSSATTWSGWTPRSSCRDGVGGLAATSTPSWTRWTECQTCHKRFRADHLQEEVAEKKGLDNPDDVDLTTVACPNCGTRGAWTEPRQFSGLLKTYLGVGGGRGAACTTCVRRPRRASSSTSTTWSTARGSSCRSASRRSARASATRSRPATSSSAPASSSRWRWSSSSSPARTTSGTSTGSTSAPDWYVDLGIDPDNLRHYEHPQDEAEPTTRPAPSTSSTSSPSGSEWGELEGIANRTDFDLTTHSEALGPGPVRTSTRPPTSATRPTSSSRPRACPRSLMTFLVDAYSEDEAPTPRAASTPASCCVSTRGSRRSRSRCCR